MHPQPDVSVIVAVYNTMPYLTECLESLAGQTIGLGRFEVVAVDDGSTDDSGAVLDGYADRYPDVFRVVHQPNSGGPAAPSNVGIGMARGRYLFFVGSDDRLGSEALERLVEAADRDRSDVVLGRMVGVNGKPVPDRAFKRPGPGADLYDWKMAWAVSNTKLFRRSLVDRLNLRYPEDMRIGSDQPFTIDAMVHARSITVLADYDYYYAVRREDDSNVTYRSGGRALLECLPRMMDCVAELLDPGARRDSILVRHFAAEIMRLLRSDFLELSEQGQVEVCDMVGRLVERYYTERIQAHLIVGKRARIAIAAQGDLPTLREFIESDERPPTLLFEGRDVFACLPGFRSGRGAYPDAIFRPLRTEIPRLLGAALGDVELERTGDRIEVRASIGAVGECGFELGLTRIGDDGRTPPAARVDRSAWKSSQISDAVEAVRNPESGRSRLRSDLPVVALSDPDCEETRWSIRLAVEFAGEVYDLPLPAADGFDSVELGEISVTEDGEGNLLATVKTG